MNVPVVAMQEIVSRVNHEVLAEIQQAEPTIQQVSYLFGHWVEICGKLQDMTAHPTERYRKFPLVILLEDLPIRRNTKLPTTTLQILIVHHTAQRYDSNERQQKIFDPILYPIYRELLLQIAKSSYFAENHPTKIQHTQIDRKYFGREEIYGSTGNIPSEYVDAIQLQNVQLTINNQFCN